MAASVRTIPSFVGGLPVEGGGAVFETLNPASGEVLAQLHDANAQDVDAAVASAQAGFDVWSALSGAERGRVLQRAADLLRSRNRELAEIEVQDCGKPLQEALVVDVQSGADVRVPQPLLNNLRVHAGLKQQGCVGVTKSLQGD